MEDVFELFYRLLYTRFNLSLYTTEDSIRYTFFYSLTNCLHLEPHEIILEYPHPQINMAKVDTFIPYLKDKCVAIEFKYHRAIPGDGNQPMPQNAGRIFRDIFRLSRFTGERDTERLFVYCTDNEMANHFRNRNNVLTEFFDLQHNETLRINREHFVDMPDVFLNAAGEFPPELAYIDIECLYTNELPNEHYLRIYSVII